MSATFAARHRLAVQPNRDPLTSLAFTIRTGGWKCISSSENQAIAFTPPPAPLPISQIAMYPGFRGVAFLDLGCLARDVVVPHFRFDRGEHAEAEWRRRRLWKISRYSKIAFASSTRVFQRRVSSSSTCMRAQNASIIGVVEQSPTVPIDGEQARLLGSVAERPGRELGGFNRSSQHLDGGGVGWGRCGSGSGRFSCIGGRCPRRGGRRWRGVRIGSGSGRRSLVG